MNDDYYYDEEPNDEVKFVDEANAYSRAGGNPFTAYYKKTEGTTGNTQKRRYAIDEDKFINGLERIYLTMMSENSPYLPSNEDINLMLNKTSQVAGLKYKNPVAYMLGYQASRGGKDRQLNKNQVQKVINDILPSLGPNIGVSAPDVVRYARYWSLYMGSN